jgi:16S rRNA (cytosine967-C5)-methyltransferase
MLDAVLRQGRTLDDASQRWQGPLDGADLALARAIAGEAIRRRIEIDALIDARTRQVLPDDAKARAVLRLALAQKLAMNVPDHALVATALPLVDGGPRKLVHGVLGAILRGEPQPLDATPLPPEVELRWASAWGADVVEAARRAIVQRPPLDLSFARQADCDAFCAETGAVSLAPLHARLSGGAPVTDLPGFGEGGWWVQDLSSSLPARLFEGEGLTILDACAAPGGKTMQLAAAGHRVTALDRSKSRLARLSDNLKRTGLSAATRVADLADVSFDTAFDAVLLDAPCSATGTFRRHPEVLTRASRRIIDQSVETQALFLDFASSMVRPGGSLIYSTWSLEPEEGELQVEAFLARRADYALKPAAPIGGVTPADRGWLRVLPGMHEDEGGMDGFFAAHLVRRAS